MGEGNIRSLFPRCIGRQPSVRTAVVFQSCTTASQHAGSVPGAMVPVYLLPAEPVINRYYFTRVNFDFDLSICVPYQVVLANILVPGTYFCYPSCCWYRILTLLMYHTKLNMNHPHDEYILCIQNVCMPVRYCVPGT